MGQISRHTCLSFFRCSAWDGRLTIFLHSGHEYSPTLPYSTVLTTETTNIFNRQAPLLRAPQPSPFLPRLPPKCLPQYSSLVPSPTTRLRSPHVRVVRTEP